MQIWNLVPIISIIGLSSTFSRNLNLHFKYALPITLSSVILILYASSSAGIVYYCSYYLYILGLYHFYVSYRLDQNFYSLCSKNKLIISLISFIIILSGSYYYYAHIEYYEDLAFWALASKEMLARHGFETKSSITAVTSDFASHPRAIAVIHYFFMLLTGYSDGGALLAHLLIYLAFLAPIMSEDRLNSFVLLLVMIAAITLPTTALRSVNAFSIVGVIFASIMMMFLSRSKDKIKPRNFLPLFILMPLIHEVGVVIGIISGTILWAIDAKSSMRNDEGGTNDYIFLACASVIVHLLRRLFLEGGIISPATLLLITDDSIVTSGHFLSFMLNLIFAFIKEGFIFLYFLAYVVYRGTRKYQETHKEVIVSAKFMICGFIAYVTVIIISALANSTPFDPGYIIKYIGIYVIGLIASCCIFIQRGKLFGQSHYLLFVLLFISIVSIMKAFDNIPVKLSLEEEIHENQVREIKKASANGHEIIFDYSNKSSNKDCIDLAYKVSPLMNVQDVNLCLNHQIAYHNFYLGHKRSLELKEGSKCKIYFKPFLLDFKAECN
ncbi:MAG: hypothetical protein SFT93_03635 [Rickettsiaceae bacterium]|nr:hypothetical protein [Rickettsiaceae bacterium]